MTCEDKATYQDWIRVERQAPCFICKKPTNWAELNYAGHLHPHCESVIVQELKELRQHQVGQGWRKRTAAEEETK